MATNDTTHRFSMARWIRLVLYVLAVGITAAGVILWLSYLRWRTEMITWDTESIQIAFGGTAAVDRITQVKFVKEWEYLALKPTAGGKNVWLHVTLSKRHCGNLMLTDPTQRDFIRPFEARYPDGPPHRPGAVNCAGFPVD